MTLIKNIAVISILFCAFAGVAQAQQSSKSSKGKEASVQKLLEVEEQLRAEQKKNEATKEGIVQLEKKVQCTYRMVKSYESCEENHPEKDQAYVACIEKAKQEKDECLLELAAEQQ